MGMMARDNPIGDTVIKNQQCMANYIKEAKIRVGSTWEEYLLMGMMARDDPHFRNRLRVCQ